MKFQSERTLRRMARLLLESVRQRAGGRVADEHGRKPVRLDHRTACASNQRGESRGGQVRVPESDDHAMQHALLLRLTLLPRCATGFDFEFFLRQPAAGRERVEDPCRIDDP